MTFAAINWLAISINLLLVLFVIVCLVMILLILMQRPKQEGLGAAFGGGVTDQVFGARTTNVLQRGTIYLGSLFFILSLVLAILVGQQNKTQKVVSDKELIEKKEVSKTDEQKTADDVQKAIEESLKTQAPAGQPIAIPPSTTDAPASIEVPAAPSAPAPAETPAAPSAPAPVETPVDPPTPAPAEPTQETPPPAPADK
ncbi:MAG: preprotein translocase subunit SecG [Akkermansiaceae bacterium]|nr:preprotein translocase subunit SecG [Akkermansiaceae bacterium]